jgi:hypothetical protein
LNLCKLEATGKNGKRQFLRMKTVMADELNVKTEISEAILNHAKQGMEEVYNRSEYITQKRNALALWADRVRSIVEGSERRSFQCAPQHSFPADREEAAGQGVPDAPRPA